MNPNRWVLDLYLTFDYFHLHHLTVGCIKAFEERPPHESDIRYLKFYNDGFSWYFIDWHLLGMAFLS